MKKKIALLLFLLCLLFCTAAAGAFAAADGGLFSFTYLPDDGAYAVSVSETGRAAASLSLPGSYEGKPVKQIADGGFRGCAALQSVTLPRGLTPSAPPPLPTVRHFPKSPCRKG